MTDKHSATEELYSVKNSPPSSLPLTCHPKSIRLPDRWACTLWAREYAVLSPPNVVQNPVHARPPPHSNSVRCSPLRFLLLVDVRQQERGILGSDHNTSPTPPFLSIIVGLGVFSLPLFTLHLSTPPTQKAPLWDRSGLFYLQVIFPCMAGLACAHCLARIAGVPPPQAVAIAVECGYQNTGIAMSIVLATFKGDTQGEALGVPLFYGLTQCLLLLPYCAVMWKLGSTHAPSSESFIKAVRGNYQPMEVAEAQLGDDSMASLERMSSLGETKEHRLPTPRDRSLCENDSVLKALLKADRQDTFDPLPEPTEMGAVPVLQ